MEPGKRKGGGLPLMSRPAETTATLETGPATVAARPVQPLAQPTPPAFARSAQHHSSGFAESVRRALEERRLFVLFPFAIIAGLVSSVIGSSQPEPAALIIVALAIAVAAPLLWRSIGAIRLLALFAAFWFGFVSLTVHGALFGTEMLSRPAYGAFEARVDGIVSESASGRRVIVSAITPVDGERSVPMRRARIVVAAGPELYPGDTIRAPVRFYPVPGPVVPGGFDTQFHAYFDGIGAYGNTTGTVELVGQGDASSPERLIDDIRRPSASGSLQRCSSRPWA